MAAEEKILLIDLAALSKKLIIRLGPDLSKELFLWLEPGELPNYSLGEQDETHFSYYGAKEITKLVLQELEKEEEWAKMLRNEKEKR